MKRININDTQGVEFTDWTDKGGKGKQGQVKKGSLLGKTITLHDKFGHEKKFSETSLINYLNPKLKQMGESKLKKGRLGIGGPKKKEIIAAYHRVASEGLYHSAKRATNDEDAVNLLTYSANQGYAPAQKTLGDYYSRMGEDFKASNYYKLAANQGNAEAKYELGLLYEIGKGVEKNDQKARGYFKSAANSGHIESQDKVRTISDSLYNLGVSHEEKNEVNLAYQCYHEAADLGHVESEFKTGFGYYYGIGNANDNNMAFNYMTKASKQGHAMAQNHLGIMYYNRGNYNRASDLYKLSADKGFARGQFHLGKMYEEGIYFKQNLNIAKHYYQLAAAQGDLDAKDRLKSRFSIS